MALLPIYSVIDELLAALKSTQQTILQAPPGAGKSTALPLSLLKQSWLNGKILMLEPRRLAARNVAARLAEQLGERPGQTIGYRMRSDSRVGPETRLEVITEGVLTRMLQRDPMLEGVSLVILDEFHERSLQADLALTLLLDIQQGLRDDLKILIMSATLDNKELAEFLPEAALVRSEGRAFPVVREYMPLSIKNGFEDSVASLAMRLVEQHSGSLLIFLPGVAEIRRVQERLMTRVEENIDICPLYGALPFEQQRLAILPPPPRRRKIVLATNIAETSLTIEGVSLVIDSALERSTVFDVKTGLTRLITQRISKASMTQRAGRAGRLGPGVCWHLVSKEQAERAAEQGEPEILRADLTDLRLELFNWGCSDVQQLRWLTLPPQAALNAADRLLKQLSILNEQGQITAQGKEAAVLPCEPRLAAMLIFAASRGANAVTTAATLAAIIEDPPRQGSRDLYDWLGNSSPQWRKRASQLQRQLKSAAGKVDGAELPYLLAAAYPDRIAKQRGQSGYYLLANGSGARLDDADALSVHEWLIVPTLLQSEANASARILLAAAFDPAVVTADFPRLLTENTTIEWNEDSGTLKTIKRSRIGQLTLRQSVLAKPSSEQLKQALLDWVRTQGLSRLNWDERAQQLRVRILRAKEWLPEYDWPDVADDDLIDGLDAWLAPSLDNVSDIRSLLTVNLTDALSRLLDWRQKQLLDQLLPERYQVPTGSAAPITYYSDRPPTLSVRLQEMFGERESPKIALGRVTVVLELLSPSRRPLQITSDLHGFWRGAYAEVKKEMKGRYPKHLWPDDPANAQPTRKTKKYS